MRHDRGSRTDDRAPRVLLVSHDATRTGAPKVALEVARALATLQVDRVVVLRRTGPLAREFREASDTVAVEPLHRLSRLLRHWNATRRIEALLTFLVATVILARYRPALVYLNTAEAAGYVRPALRRGLPVVLHVHESGDDATRMLRPHRLGRRLGDVALVAVSRAARADLSRATGVAADAIHLVPTSASPAAVQRLAAAGAAPYEADSLIVGMCGPATEGKGADLWVEVARLVVPRTGGVRFVWVGDSAPQALRRRIADLGIAEAVTFVPSVGNPYPAMRGFDVMAFTSRAETAGLVVQEAMSLGRPIVAFDVPAVAEQLGGCGRLVTTGDVRAMAGEIVVLLEDRALRDALGDRARDHALATFSLEQFDERVRALVGARLPRP